MRKPRFELESELVHVTSRGNNKRRLFSDDEDFRTFLRLVGRSAGRYDWTVFTYCLMTNHVHLVLRAPQDHLSNGLRELIGGYARAANKRHGRVNHLFGDRFHSVSILFDVQLAYSCRYALLNPVRMENPLPLSYRWSSFAANCGLAAPPPFLAVRELLGLFGSRPESAAAVFRAFVVDGHRQYLRQRYLRRFDG